MPLIRRALAIVSDVNNESHYCNGDMGCVSCSGCYRTVMQQCPVGEFMDGSVDCVDASTGQQFHSK